MALPKAEKNLNSQNWLEKSKDALPGHLKNIHWKSTKNYLHLPQKLNKNKQRS